MIPWEQRPREVAYLLNPAFCGEVLRRCIKKYQDDSSSPFPYPLIFLILPIVLHKKTRDIMPSTTRKLMHVWLEENQEVKIGFAERAKSLIDITRETLIFLLQLEVIKIQGTGLFTVNSYKRKKINGYDVGEIGDCFKKAEILGSWLARSGSIATIFLMWGVRP